MPITRPSKFSSQNNGKYADLLSIGKFDKGINNITNEYSLPNDTLLDAINVDIDKDGKIKTRKKYTKLFDGKFHSLWNNGNKCLVVKDGNLSLVNDSLDVVSIQNGYSRNDKVYYVEVLGEIYISNGKQTTKINKFNNVEAWSIHSPQIEPEVTATAKGTGSLKAGKYLISHTYSYGNYETGGSPFAEIEVKYDDFKLELSCLPGGTVSTGASFYISQCNGSELYKAKIVSGYNTEVDLLDNYGIPLKNEDVDGIPALTHLTKTKGRIFGVKDNIIIYSEVENLRQYRPAANIIYIDNTKINMLIGVDSGLYVSTEQGTYFVRIAGLTVDKNESQLIKLFEKPAIEGTNFEEIRNRRVGWLSQEGYIIGGQDGTVENLTKDKFDFSKNYKSGAAIYKEFDTNKQVIFSLQESGENTNLQSSGYKK